MQTPPAMTRAQWITGLVGLTLLGLMLRVPGIVSGGLWRDEAECVAIAAMPSAGALVGFLARDESHPPLFYLLLRLWQGIGLRSDAALLALSVAFGTAQIPAAMALVRRHVGSHGALLAGLLVALSGQLVRYADQVRPYSLLPLLGIVAIDALLRLLRPTPRRADAALYVLANVAMLYTHNWAALFWAAQWVALGAILLGRSAPERSIAPWLVRHAAIGALWLPWLPILRHQSVHAGHGANGLASNTVGRLFAATPIGGLPPALQVVAVAALLSLPLAVATLVGKKRRSSADEPIVALFAVPYATYAGVLALSPLADLSPGRCNLPSRLLLIVALAALAAVLRVRPVAVRAALVGALALAAVALAAPWQLRSIVGAPRTNAPAVAAGIERTAHPRELVLVAPSTVAPTLHRYLPASASLAVYPDLPRTAAISYADVAERDRSPLAYDAARSLIRRTIAEGRAVVLVTHRDNDVGEPDPSLSEIPVQPTLWHYGQWRAEQLARYLKELCPQVESIDPPCRPGQDECLRALRFTPPG